MVEQKPHDHEVAGLNLAESQAFVLFLSSQYCVLKCWSLVEVPFCLVPNGYMSKLSFLKIAQAGVRTWDLLVFIYFLLQAAPKTTRLLRALEKYFVRCSWLSHIRQI